MNEITMPEVEPLAREFAKRVLIVVGEENHSELKRRTQQILAARDTICATHDFTDANCSMLDAWMALGGPETFAGETPEQEVYLNRMSAAWNMAKQHLFWLL